MSDLPAGATATLKAAALKAGAVVCGVADAAAFDAHAPPKQRPADLLPGARSVVVVGGAQPRAGDWAATSRAVLETMGTTERIQSVGRRLAQLIESELGYYALFVPPGTVSGDRPFLSLMLAAELAGVGSRSLAGPVLNREHGFLYWSAVITTARPARFTAYASNSPPPFTSPGRSLGEVRMALRQTLLNWWKIGVPFGITAGSTPLMCATPTASCVKNT
jgi:hypothetical protein